MAFHLTPESSALRMAESCSVKSGSTLVWMDTSWPRASAAFSLTARLESCRAFRKVVWSCGKKGLRRMPTWRKKGVLSLIQHTCWFYFDVQLHGCRYEPLPEAEWESQAERSLLSRQNGLPRYEWGVRWCGSQKGVEPQQRSVWWRPLAPWQPLLSAQGFRRARPLSGQEGCRTHPTQGQDRNRSHLRHNHSIHFIILYFFPPIMNYFESGERRIKLKLRARYDPHMLPAPPPFHPPSLTE